MQGAEDIMEMLLDWLNKFGIGITMFCAFVIIIFRLKNDVAYKTARAMGKGKLMELLLLLNGIVSKMSLEKAKKLLQKFESEYTLKLDMEEGAIDINALLSMKGILSQPKVTKALKEYKEAKEYGVLKNKKRWNRVRNDPEVDIALEAILDSLVANVKLRALAARDKGNVGQIEALIKAIKSDENMMKNRAKRKELEKYNEELRTQEKELNLDRIQEKLHDIFKGAKEK
jgi:hypothetical protein